MFYAQFVLSKKGPLAKIWLAAHWEKKLSKAQIYETSVQDAVQEILQPKVKIALRTTGHLLLGIVRIYSRKTQYLLADCNEAFLKIKMAFRPGQVDLIDEPHEAPKNAITLPDVCADFEGPPDFNDFDLSQQLQFNQSRLDDITLKDDFISDFPHQNAFSGGDFGDDFGEKAQGACVNDFGLTDEDLAMAESLERVAHEREKAREQTPCLDKSEAPCQLIYGDGAYDDDCHEGADHHDDVAEQEMETTMPVEVPGLCDDGLQLGASADNISEETSSVAAPESSFALEPLADGAIPEKAQRARRRRRLVIDESIELSGAEMKANLADFRDTLSPLDLAPPSRMLMKMKERGTVDKLFNLPGSRFVRNRTLIKQYHAHLTFASRLSHNSAFASVSGSEASYGEQSSIAEEVRQDLNYDENIEGGDNIPKAEGTAELDDFPNDVSEAFSVPLMMGGGSPYHEPDAAGDHDEDHHSPLEPERKKPRRSQMEKSVDDDEAAEGDEDHRWTKRTQNVLNNISSRIQAAEAGEILFSDLLTKGSTRKTAAQKFYTLLVLKKSQAIDVRQDTPFGDIHITAGPQMNATSS